jgi:hypothetical protein
LQAVFLHMLQERSAAPCTMHFGTPVVPEE